MPLQCASLSSGLTGVSAWLERPPAQSCQFFHSYGDGMPRQSHYRAMPLPLDELRDLVARHAGAATMLPGILPGIVLGKEIAPTPPCPEIVGPMLSVVVQGSKRMAIGAQDLTYGAGQYAILPVDLMLDAHVVSASREVPFLGFGLVLRPEPIAELLLAAGKQLPDRTGVKGVSIGTLTEELSDPIMRLLKLLDRPADIPVLASSIEREILWRLICGPDGSLLRQLGAEDSQVARISRATRWLRSHLTEVVRIEELADVAGMSVTSFHRHFRAVTSVSPIQYQKHLRLQAARTRIIAGTGGVAEIGFSVGYENPSQFSREYRRMFGHPPGRDAVKAL